MTSIFQTAARNGIFFVTDADFALPTIVAALKVRLKLAKDIADVRIIVCDMAEESVARMREVLTRHAIDVDVMQTSRFFTFDCRKFNKTHVPVSTLGRFFMLDVVPERYDRILYLDGDIWPTGDVRHLLTAPLPDGCIAAAEDRNFFRRYEMGPVGRRTREYLLGLGLDRDAGYFNAGVILTRGETWRALSAEAFRFFLDHMDVCLYHDQSALNAVAGERRVRLAPQWNFAASYFDWYIRPPTPPQIVHFAGGEKPWLLPFHSFYAAYADEFAPLAGLGLRYQALSQAEVKAQARRARLRWLRDRTMLHRCFLKQMTYEMLVRTAVVA